MTGTERLDARSEVTGRLAVARYRGTETNRRLEVAGAFTRQLGAPWAVGAGLRVLGFRDDLNDGYFDPSFYALGEVTGRWDWNRGAVSGLVEVAPGVEHIAGAAVRGAVRASTRAGYVYSPGREVALRAVYATTRMQSAASGGRGYSYWAVSMVVGWLF